MYHSAIHELIESSSNMQHGSGPSSSSKSRSSSSSTCIISGTHASPADKHNYGHSETPFNGSPAFRERTRSTSDTVVQSQRRVRHYSVNCDVTGTYDLVLKVILLGDQGVGKTSFLKALKVHPDVEKVRCRCRLAQAQDHVELQMVTSSGKSALVRLCDTGGESDRQTD